MPLFDLSAQVQLMQLLFIAVIELCSALILVNSSLTVMLGPNQDWLKKTFTIPLFSGILFLSLVIFQSLGFLGFTTLQPGTALLFALYSVFVFLLSWNIHRREGSA